MCHTCFPFIRITAERCQSGHCWEQIDESSREKDAKSAKSRKTLFDKFTHFSHTRFSRDIYSKYFIKGLFFSCGIFKRVHQAQVKCFATNFAFLLHHGSFLIKGFMFLNRFQRPSDIRGVNE